MRYIDISEHNAYVIPIDFERLKSSVDGIIIRAGWGQNHIDKHFVRHISECNRLGIPCGAYWFSYALNADMAKKEAEYLLKAVEPYKVELPLAFDFEYDSIQVAKNNGVNVTKALATAMTYAFCETIEKGGYWVVNYTNPDLLSRLLDPNIPKRFGLWLASWNETPNLKKPPRDDAQIWQWSSKQQFPGISGNVDCSESYKDFKKIITDAGFNHLKKPTVNVDPHQIALQWCKNTGICTDPNATLDKIVTWSDLAWFIFSTYGPEDAKNDSGLLS